MELAPFFAVFLIGGAAGRFARAEWAAWTLGLSLPITHFLVSVATGRAGENFVSYVLPVNLALLALALGGIVAGRVIRRRRKSRS